MWSFSTNNHQYPVIILGFGSMRSSSDDCILLIWLRWNRFLRMQYPEISFYLFKDGARPKDGEISFKQSLNPFSPGANVISNL